MATISFYILAICTVLYLGTFVFYLTAIDSYMDEIYHIPQAQKYCHENFLEWDPKITTFPGLYITSYIIYKLLALLSLHIKCSVTFLRATNTGLSFIILFALYKVCSKRKDANALAILLFNYPLSAFYYALYYTDTVSTASVLLLVSMPLQSSSTLRDVLLLCMVSGCSILMRQTNAVWLLFMIGTTMLKSLEQRGLVGRHEDFSLQLLFRFLSSLWNEKLPLLRLTWPLLVPVVSFAAFVVANGAIVVGDKSNHVPSLHFAMVAHALAIYGTVSLPFILLEAVSSYRVGHEKVDKQSTATRLKSVVNLTLRRGDFLLVSGLSVVITTGFVWGSLSHPFLLADNRHYTFYIWRRLLATVDKRVLLSPIYGVLTYLSLHRLCRSRGALWLLIYLVAVTISLAPTPLLELRYFTPAVMLAMLHSPEITSPSGQVVAVVETTAFILINIITFYVFVNRPFLWSDGTIARFMY